MRFLSSMMSIQSLIAKAQRGARRDASGLGRRAARAGFRLAGRSLVARPAGWAVFKIRFVPARALELKARRSHLLAEAVGLASRALRQRCIAEFLQHILRMAAGGALIGVNRHGETKQSKQKKPDGISLCLATSHLHQRAVHYMRVLAHLQAPNSGAKQRLNARSASFFKSA